MDTITTETEWDFDHRMDLIADAEADECIERYPNHVPCITCTVWCHPANMYNVYDGEHQCQECRWGS